MTTTHLVLRWLHISMGMLALLSGAAAMVFRKGSPLHGRAGQVFAGSMVLMAASGVVISIFIDPIMGNVMGGGMTLYLVVTGWAAAARAPGAAGRLEVGAALFGLAVGVTGIACGIIAASSSKGLLHQYPPVFYFIMAGAALIGTGMDARMIAGGGVTGARRTSRHLVRMCLAMFMATASFFLGQAKLFPPAVRQSGVLRIPVLLVVGALVYWVVRVRVLPAIRRARAARRAAVPRPA